MTELQSFGLGLAYVVLGVVILLVAKLLKDFATPYKIDEELTVKDNPAVGVVVAGYFVGVTIVFLGATIGAEPEGPVTFSELGLSLLVDSAYAIGGMVGLLIVRVVVDKLVLTKFSMVKEIIVDRNTGTGAVEAGCMIATALVVAGAIHGEGGGPFSALVFFGLGQLVLVIFGCIYQIMVRYNVHDEIEKDNVAAGVALALNMIAMGIIVLKAIAGDLVDWPQQLTWFGIYVVLGIVSLLALHKITDVLFLPNTTIGHEIANDKNMNAAWMEGAIATSIASIIFFVA